jgi:sugar lactone lactonase YvrE
VFVSGSNVLIADQNDDAVRQSNGTAMSTIAGVLTTGQPFNTAFSGDGSAATSASVRSPVGVAADSSGNLYIADTLNDVIRKVDASSGDISTIAGAGDLPCYGSAGLGQPCGDGGAATAAEFSFPTDVFLDASGNIYIADYDPSFVSVIREIVASTGNIKTVAGVYSRPGYSGDNGPATAAQLSGDCSSCSSRLSIAVDKAGVLYIADTGNNVIRAVNTNASGSVKVAGVTIAAGNIATIAGVQSTPCASATSACGDGGAATAASLNAPGGVAVDSDGNIYISDSNDNRVRIVNSTGTINKFAGTGTACTSSCGDGGPATAANLDVPQHVMVDFAGNVYIADSADYEIREVTVSDGTINAVVDSSQTHGFGGDGGTATAALLASPYGLAADGSGNLYISDIQQWRIRKVTNQVLTAPTATLSTSSISFPSEGTGVASPAQNVTIKNNGFGTALAISKVAIGGTDTKDFAISSNACGSSLLAGSSCTIGVTFTPTTTGSRSATLTITDNASGGSQNVSLTGTGLAESFTIPKPATPAPISAGSSATYTISISPVNGFNGSVTLSCTKGLPTGASCSFSPSSIKPGTNSTLTISTTGPTSGALTAPAVRQQSAPMFAMWLLLPAMLLSTAGMSTAQRKKLISYLLLTLAIAGVLFLVACGGGSSSTPTPTGGTPSGTYTVTVQGTAGALNATTTVTLTVQ